MAVNVHFNGQTTENLSRIELLAWVNRTLLSEFKKVEELCTGAAYCQLMDVLFPGCVHLKRIKFCTNVEHEFLANLRMFQNALVQLKVSKTVPIERLAKGRFQDNFEFLQWFKKFYDANYDGKQYDPMASRNNALMGYGTPSTLRASQRMNTVTATHSLPGRVGKRINSAGSITRPHQDQNQHTGLSYDAAAPGDDSVKAPIVPKERKVRDLVDTLNEEINDLTMKIQYTEMSREYYYKKLVLIETLINEYPEDSQDVFCEKVKEIMYANE